MRFRFKKFGIIDNEILLKYIEFIIDCPAAKVETVTTQGILVAIQAQAT